MRQRRRFAWRLDSFGGSGAVSPPTNSVLPTITGTPQKGQTLTCSTGTWTGSPTFTYQWVNSSTGNISGATSSTYTPQATDIGDTLTCKVTATNTAGSASAMSNATGTVVAAPLVFIRTVGGFPVSLIPVP